ncbi:MAG TPA: helix-turn-helix domain-containing protein [Chthoniobacterales bacterium]|jgi:cytoskeletal protein RodZ|nr:helix-turn-helix domain-containing protein [Chthoniobacterales bacterium]
MAESVGRRLQQARLARNLEIEDVAETTKIRPERIIDLEADEYTLFPNLTYAKSFLAKYAKFLEINIQEELDRFQVERAISLNAYQYLTSQPQPKRSSEARRITPKGFRVPPAVVAILLLIVLVGVPLFSYLALNVPRVVGVRFPGAKNGEIERPKDAPVKAGLEQKPPDLRSESGVSAPGANPAIASQNQKQDDEAKEGLAPASSPIQARLEEGVEVRRALPVDAPPAADAQVRAVAPTFPDKKLEVRILKRTYVKVTKDEESAQPVFEGFAGPDSRPIVVAGKRFWVHVLDKGAVEVRKDGQVVPSDSGDIVIN